MTTAGGGLFDAAEEAGGPLVLGAPLAATHPDVRVVERIGAGGMGVVYRVTDGREVQAVKVLRSALRHMAEARQRFALEQALLERLAHDGIVGWHGNGTTDDGLPFVLMQWIDGVRFDALPRGTFLRDQVRLVQQLAETLAYLHAQQVAHRDLKGSNILVERGTNRAVLCDFGIARDLAQPPSTASALGTPGTPLYLPPDKVHTERTDVWSLATLFYELYAGRPPVAGHYEPPSVAGYPSATDAVLARAWAHDPAKRYPTPLSFAEALEASLDTHAQTPLSMPPVSIADLDDATAPTSRQQPVAPNKTGPGRSRELVFGPPTLIDQVTRLLRSVSTSEREPASRIAGLSQVGSLKVSCTDSKDARQDARNPPRRALPQLVRFSPSGHALVTASGAWGCTYWRLNGSWLEPGWADHPWSCYGNADELHWSYDGDHLMMASTSPTLYYVEFFDTSRGHFHDRPGRSVASAAGARLRRREVHERDDVQLVWPWRPGTRTVLVPLNFDELSCVDADALPLRAVAPKWMPRPVMLVRNLIAFPLRAALNIGKEWYEREIHESVLDTISFRSLGTAHLWTLSLVWHPSGQFIAITSRSHAGEPSVRVIHFDSAAVIATHADCRAIAWSRRGGELLLERHPATGDYQDRFATWDASTGSVAPITEAVRCSRDFASSMASLSNNAPCNASGELMFVTSDSGLGIARVEDGAVLASLPQVHKAVWSPSDPACLATIGGADAPEALRIWRLS